MGLWDKKQSWYRDWKTGCREVFKDSKGDNLTVIDKVHFWEFIMGLSYWLVISIIFMVTLMKLVKQNASWRILNLVDIFCFISSPP